MAWIVRYSLTFQFSADVKKPESLDSGFLQCEVGALRIRSIML